MPDIKKEITINGNTYTLELSSPFGSGEHYQVLINNYYQGRIHKKDGVWQALDEFKPSDKHPIVFSEKLFKRMGELIEGEEK